MEKREYKTEITINGETTLTIQLYDNEIELLLAYLNKLQDIHKGIEIKESDVNCVS